MSVTLKLQTDPGDLRPVYVAGNFNDWTTDNPTYKLEATGAGYYRIQLPVNHDWPNPLEYKYTRGNWSQVEVDRFGNSTGNRTLPHFAGEHTDTVVRWQHDGRYYRPELLPRIEMIDEHQFNFPEFIRTRRITALLPHDYYHTSRRYPVLYLQDGQNLFEDYAPFGTWGVDKRLAVLRELGLGHLIVVAIDHAKEQRAAEFTPTFRTRLGRGQGRDYARFLTESLKPYIDQRYRTQPDHANTGIGGSSMGGLISIYAGLMYPDVYGKLMIFSPSLWVTPRIPFHRMELSKPYRGRIYLYAGGEESRTMVPNLENFRRELEAQTQRTDVAIKVNIDPAGRHNEAHWGREFPYAVEWLFGSLLH